MSSESADTRTRILKAAWTLLESGDSTVRMSDIAKTAGISRQAVYLHFPGRADLLIATVRYVDEVKDVAGRLQASRNADSGLERLEAFVEAWVHYIPEIHGVAKALLAMGDTDEAARLAWADRMAGLREGFQAAVDALDRDGMLSPALTVTEATDILWSMLSVQTWERFILDCGWSQQAYGERMKLLARKMLVAGSATGRTRLSALRLG
ncbi:TetR/AcrR family transcriptional regulator [Magnetospira sp. QH-2]|uniref:TetR/AcrR family transcriptional regulator n=1 Tax=Magnetospira sp. (strain QH-2) TaxID=1288970 RepID=UPI0005FA08F2|nr:TetR/AcrR family transcriptional regulator [Magnetospira sp. QH-2]